MSETTKTAMADGTYLAATLAGRCANGYERDQGSRVHAVQYSETLARNGYATDAAACGAKPGRRSAGWSLRTDLAVNCPRCIKRIAGVSASDGKTGRAACASFRCVRNKGHDPEVKAAAPEAVLLPTTLNTGAKGRNVTFEIIESDKGLIKAWTRGVPVEEKAKDQLRNVAAMPFIHKHVAVMPDVHWGMGATVGSVIATKGAIIPAAVGVDIGCGMAAQRTSLTASDLPDSLAGLRSAIEARIPHGRTNNGGPGDRGAWGEIPATAASAMGAHLEALKAIVQKHPKIGQAAERAPTHAGTLGTGNHFVEVCLDEEQRVWLMLHSGSRGIGNRIGSYFIEKAKEDMRRWFINLPDMDLAYMPQGSELFNDYFGAVNWAQGFARINRNLMMDAAMAALAEAIPKPFTCDCEAVNCHHNYVSWERHFGDNVMVTRKGAVDAHEGVMGIIPGSMGAKSFIVRGKGNREAFCSCSHGAGRRMSRGEATRTFTVEDHAKATAGVECRKDEGVLDETPAAYKSIDEVMAAQSDLVDVMHTLKQVVCVKG